MVRSLPTVGVHSIKSAGSVAAMTALVMLCMCVHSLTCGKRPFIRPTLLRSRCNPLRWTHSGNAGVVVMAMVREGATCLKTGAYVHNRMHDFCCCHQNIFMLQQPPAADRVTHTCVCDPGRVLTYVLCHNCRQRMEESSHGAGHACQSGRDCQA